MVLVSAVFVAEAEEHRICVLQQWRLEKETEFEERGGKVEANVHQC